MFKGKVVFITGGTSYIGSALCKAFAGYGAKVIFSYHNAEEKAREMIKKNKNFKGIQINLRDVKDIDKKIRALYEEIDTIDILVNNAGVTLVMPFAMLEEEDVDCTLDINIKGMIFITKAVARKMIRNKKGSIVNIGSLVGHRMLNVPIPYAVSKAAVMGFTYSLAAELSRFNIRVNSVVPGLIDDGVSRSVPDELKTEFLQHCAAGRMGTGQEVAEVVCFIASDKASYINGQNIFVDGGV